MGKEVTTKESELPLAIMGADPGELRELFAANMSGASQFDLDRVSCPTGGGTVFEVPDLDEGVGHESELTGIVLAFSDPRAYWLEPFEDTGGGTPPDCSSRNGEFGYGNPGGECARCPMAQFGTIVRNGKQGRGQACKQMRVLLFLRCGEYLPIVLTVPPTSLQAAKKFFMRLAGRGRLHNSVVIGIKLQKTKSKDGIAYAEYVFSQKRPLTPDEHELVKHLSAASSRALKMSGAVNYSEAAQEAA